MPILYSTSDGTFRTEEFKNGVGPLRIIRYIRYGVKKKDPVLEEVYNKLYPEIVMPKKYDGKNE